MAQSVPHANYIFPRNTIIFRFAGFTDFGGGLADYFDRFYDGEQEFAVIIKIISRFTNCKLNGFLCRIEHVF
jgi:hypothetical protein